jgi:hypothetical protein
MPVTGTSLALTVTEQVADLPPALAEMFAKPTLTAVTVPLSTVATDVFELDQATVLSVAFEGVTVAVRLEVPPTVSDSVVWFSVTPVTATTCGLGSGFGSGFSLGVQPTANDTTRDSALNAAPNLVFETNIFIVIQLYAHIKIAIFSQDVSGTRQRGGRKAGIGTFLKDFE